jgi:hypothetical protein
MSFTAKESGMLTGAMLPESGTEDTQVQIGAVNIARIPTDQVLASTSVPSDAYPTIANFDSDSAASVVAGTKYALILRRMTETGYVGWSGATDNPCRSDSLYVKYPDRQWQVYNDASHDAMYSTYVSPPDTTIDTSLPSFSNSDDARFEFSSSWTPANGAIANFQCSLDSNGFGECISPRTYFDLPEGTYTFKVRGYASYGSPDLTPAEYAWTVDTKEPKGSVTINGGRFYTSSRVIILKLSAANPTPGLGITSMRIKNAGGDWSAWQDYDTRRDWKLSRGVGEKIVYVQYKDQAGNNSAIVSDTITYRP